MQGRLDAPLVSVIIPTYNCAEFLREAIESVLQQEYSNLELIVVDDGSTDDTPEVLRSFTDPRLTVHRQAKAGVSAARNAGLDRARGDYISFLDADDRWLPGKLNRDISLLQETASIGIVVSNFVRFVHKTGERLSDQFAFYPELKDMASVPLGRGALKLVGNAFDAVINMGEIPAYHSALTYRREVIGQSRFLPVVRDSNGTIIVLEDVDFFLSICRKTEIAFNCRPMMEMRRHRNNSTREYDSLTYAKLRSLERLRNSVQLDASRQRVLARRIAREWANVGYWHLQTRRWGAAGAAFLRTGLQGRPLAAIKGFLILARSMVGGSGYQSSFLFAMLGGG